MHVQETGREHILLRLRMEWVNIQQVRGIIEIITRIRNGEAVGIQI
jgi:hypothetical protein